MPLPRAPGTTNLSNTPLSKPPAVGVKMVHHIHVRPGDCIARSITRFSTPMIDRWKKTAAKPQSAPAINASANTRCVSDGTKRRKRRSNNMLPDRQPSAQSRSFEDNFTLEGEPELHQRQSRSAFKVKRS